MILQIIDRIFQHIEIAANGNYRFFKIFISWIILASLLAMAMNAIGFVIHILMREISVTLRIFRRGYPPEHCDVDGELKPEQEKPNV